MGRCWKAAGIITMLVALSSLARPGLARELVVEITTCPAAGCDIDIATTRGASRGWWIQTSALAEIVGWGATSLLFGGEAELKVGRKLHRSVSLALHAAAGGVEGPQFTWRTGIEVQMHLGSRFSVSGGGGFRLLHDRSFLWALGGPQGSIRADLRVWRELRLVARGEVGPGWNACGELDSLWAAQLGLGWRF